LFNGLLILKGKVMKKITLGISIFATAFIIGCGDGVSSGLISGGSGNDGNSSDNGNSGSNSEVKANNVALGPISEANISIYDLNGTKIYSTTTYTLNENDENNNRLVSFSQQKVGKFKIDKNIINDYKDKLLKIIVNGGEDIDANDNGVVDYNPTKIKGKLYAFVYGRDLLDENVTINELTTLAAIQIMHDNIKTEDRIEEYLSNFRKVVMKNNLPLYSFNPANLDSNRNIKDLDKLQNPDVFNDILNSTDFQNYIKNNKNKFKDSDGDGLFDLFETMIGSDKNSADSDGDGINDYGEIYGGMNPTINDESDNEDTLFKYQWHLKNTGQNAGARNGGVPGYDLNVTDVWKKYTGDRKIKVGVVDTGIEFNHPDLKTQIDLNDSYRYSDDSHDPSPDENQLANHPSGCAHGTAVAGIIAAKSFNKIGVRGIAPSVTLVGLNTFSGGGGSSFLDALSKEVNVSSNSWGIGNSSYIIQAPEFDDVIADGAKKGTIYVFAAGNERDDYKNVKDGSFYFGNSNNSSLANNKYVIVVAAMDANGSYASYSNFGANVLVAAPSGEYGSNYPATVTTDLTGTTYGFDHDKNYSLHFYYTERFDVPGNENGDYTNRMNGTSAATPMVSGVVVALMLNANPNLNYRDVKYILAHTARKIDENNPDWNKNAAGLWFNPNY
jgi:hypothetical protein